MNPAIHLARNSPECVLLSYPRTSQHLQFNVRRGCGEEIGAGIPVIELMPVKYVCSSVHRVKCIASSVGHRKLDRERIRKSEFVIGILGLENLSHLIHIETVIANLFSVDNIRQSLLHIQ